MPFGGARGMWSRIAEACAVTGSLAVVACGGGGGTSTEQEPECLPQAADASCTDPLYKPTFENLFNNTLSQHCGVGGCHVSSDPPLGLALDQIDTAYQDLMAKDPNGHVRVKGGDLKCGELIVRLESVNKPWSMPRTGSDAHLDEPTLCAIRQWIAQGAQR